MSSKKKEKHIFSKNKGFKIFGLGKQDMIKYFFGGNATIAIVILVMICAFLGKEAVQFFPAYQKNLELYRKSGQEFADFSDDQLKYQQRLKSLTVQIKMYELYEQAGKDAEVYPVFSDMKRIANGYLKSPKKELDLVKGKINSIADNKWAGKTPADYGKERDELFALYESKRADLVRKAEEVAPLVKEADLEPDFRGKLASPQVFKDLQEALVAYYDKSSGPHKFVTDLADYEVGEYKDALEANDGKLDAEDVNDARDELFWKIQILEPLIRKTEWEHAKGDILAPANVPSFIKYFTSFVEEPDYVLAKSQEGARKRDDLLKSEQLFADYEKVEQGVGAKLPAFEAYTADVRQHALKTKQRAISYSTAAEQKKALEEGMKLAKGKELEDMEIEYQRILNEPPNFSELNQHLYDSKEKHKAALTPMMEETVKALEGLPNGDTLINTSAKIRSNKLHDLVANYQDFMSKKTKLIEGWKHDVPVGKTKAFFGFFFGEKWVTNSTWNDFFGLTPLFGGSIGVMIIAIGIALPFSVGGAIYVNRIATPIEQNTIKPVIEFIQAIPSIVLAFFGVVVLGRWLVEVTNSDLLKWIPGFPVEGNLNMLNAGILLGLMAIPTIFTLAEDAINNVPKAYYEASLALGASKLQTVFRVIFPCAMSGIVAAVLLGIGRIIGETMVVLLVAGGRLAWPESWTDPVHTMTGIIAQETGEVSQGSIGFRALFMVGLVLFIISLSLNSAAQTVIKRWGKK